MYVSSSPLKYFYFTSVSSLIHFCRIYAKCKLLSVGPTLLNKKAFNYFFFTGAKHQRAVNWVCVCVCMRVCVCVCVCVTLRGAPALGQAIFRIIQQKYIILKHFWLKFLLQNKFWQWLKKDSWIGWTEWGMFHTWKIFCLTKRTFILNTLRKTYMPKKLTITFFLKLLWGEFQEFFEKN